MASELNLWLATGGIFVSLLVLGVSIWNLYLSHYQESPSEVSLTAEDAGGTPQFSGGNNAIGEDAWWKSTYAMKLMNNSEKDAYVQSEEHSLVGLKSAEEIDSTPTASIEVNDHRSGLTNTEIPGHSSNRERLSVKISPDEDIGILVDADTALVEHSLLIEDNMGSYEVTAVQEIEMVGPDGAIDNWNARATKS